MPRERRPAALYFCSGATGLCYEVLWSRLFSYEFGVSIFGVAVTVAAFLLGLGIGALLGRRAFAAFGPARALRTFALLEAAVAAYSLGLPGLDAALQPALAALAAQLAPGAWHALQAALALLALALPATALGAAFPAILRALPQAAPEDGHALAVLYASNCLGAALGALLSLCLLALLGWSAALAVTAAAGSLVALLAWRTARTAADRPAALPAAPLGSARRPWGAALAYAGVGACALVLEVAWTRLYGMVLLRTEYVLAVILAVFLLGTAAGSLLAARPGAQRRLRRVLPLLACGGALAGLAALPPLSRWLQAREFDSLGAALAVQGLLLAASTLPCTVALGAWLPLLGRRLGEARPGGGAGPLLYGANCLGAALGALATVAIGIPLLGTTGTLVLAALALLPLGASLAPRPAGPGWRAQARAQAAWCLALPPALALAWALHAFPAPQRLLPESAQPGRELARYEDAVSLNHVTEAPDGQRVLLTDLQHMDASSDPSAVRIQSDQARLPLLLHRAPHSVLFLGLGTGISAAGSLPFAPLARTAVEISPGAIDAARRWFAPVNGGVMAQLEVHADDARHYLLAHPQRYDVIVGDLFHPDLAGMSRLLSVEQFTRARAHLNPDGVFAQWLALNQFDAAALDAVLRSFRAAFPDGVLFFDGMHLALVGSTGPQAWGANLRAQLQGLPQELAERRSGGEGAWTWLARYCGPVDGGTGPLQRDAEPLIEYRLPQLRYAARTPLGGLLRRLLRQRPPLDAAAHALGLDAARDVAFADAYGAAGLALQGWADGVDGDAAAMAQQLRLAYESNPREHWVAAAVAQDLVEQAAGAGRLQDPAVLARILQVDPEQLDALRALWHLQRAGTAAAAAPDALARLRALAPLDRELAAAAAAGDGAALR
jgi:spermidine synthase